MTTTTERHIELSITEAADLLTVAEVRKIEQRFGGQFGVKPSEGGITGTSMTVGVIWAYERRAALASNASDLPSWESLDDWTIRDLNGYFAEDSVEVSEDEPESPEGKGD